MYVKEYVYMAMWYSQPLVQPTWSPVKLRRAELSLYAFISGIVSVTVVRFSKLTEKDVVLSSVCHQILPLDPSSFVHWQNSSMATVLLHLE